MMFVDVTKTYDDEGQLCGHTRGASFTKEEMQELYELDATSWPDYLVAFFTDEPPAYFKAINDDVAKEMALTLYEAPFEVQRVRIEYTTVHSEHLFAVTKEF